MQTVMTPIRSATMRPRRHLHDRILFPFAVSRSLSVAARLMYILRRQKAELKGDEREDKLAIQNPRSPVGASRLRYRDYADRVRARRDEISYPFVRNATERAISRNCQRLIAFSANALVRSRELRRRDEKIKRGSQG